jgi:cell division septation protein DedD
MIIMDALNFDFASLQQQLQPGAISEKKDFGPDERFWKLSRGDDDTGTAVIRLLVDKNRVPFVKVFHHQFSVYDPTKQKKRWFIEPSPQTIGLPCPVSEKWQELYNLGTAEAKEEAKKFSRKIKYVTNIKVINDPANPANNGKIFLWEFGTKLLDKFLAAMNPGADDLALGIKPTELYNPIAGANIMLKIKKSAGFFNYDDTTILPASAEWNSMDEAVTEIDANTHELQEFLEPTHFKSYDELKSRMEFVITGVKSQPTTQETPAQETTQQQTVNTGMPPAQETPTPTPVEASPAVTPEPVPEPKTVKTSAPADDDLDFLDDL